MKSYCVFYHNLIRSKIILTAMKYMYGRLKLLFFINKLVSLKKRVTLRQNWLPLADIYYKLRVIVVQNLVVPQAILVLRWIYMLVQMNSMVLICPISNIRLISNSIEVFLIHFVSHIQIHLRYYRVCLVDSLVSHNTYYFIL